MKKKLIPFSIILATAIFCFDACKADDDTDVVITTPVTPTDSTVNPVDTTTNPIDTTNMDTTVIASGMHLAFADFDTSSFTIYLSGTDVVIETDGLPNHTSPYWSTTNALYVAPTVTSTAQMAPGNIDNFNGMYTLTVPSSAAKASTTSSTGLGAIGFAVSGSVIYNDEEGPNVPLDNAVGSLDFNGAHTGPQSYHYHLEPISFSNDDENLIGIISDGFFIYGRKCNSTGTYPTDLDASGGHTSTTQHTTTAEYHYHMENTPTTISGSNYYIIFPGDYQGTPNPIQ